MSVAGQIVQELQLTKDGEVGSGAESAFEFGHGRDFVAQEVLAKGVGIEGEWSHNVIVPTNLAFNSEL